MFGDGTKQRIIQEFVPGKQVTLAHVIARPEAAMLQKVGLGEHTTKAVGILTLTPSETVLIAADIVLKVANVEIGFMDRFNGSLIVVGSVADVEEALKELSIFLQDSLGFTIAPFTKS